MHAVDLGKSKLAWCLKNARRCFDTGKNRKILNSENDIYSQIHQRAIYNSLQQQIRLSLRRLFKSKRRGWGFTSHAEGRAPSLGWYLLKSKMLIETMGIGIVVGDIFNGQAAKWARKCWYGHGVGINISHQRVRLGSVRLRSCKILSPLHVGQDKGKARMFCLLPSLGKWG